MVQTADIDTWAIQAEDAPAHIGRLLASVVLTEGVVDVSGDAFEVLQDTGSNMQIKVGSGTIGDLGVVAGDAVAGQGVYVCEHQDATTTLTVPASDPSQDRIDRVVLRIYDDEADSSGNSYADLEVLEGTPAGSPSAPALPDGAISLATIEVDASVTAVTDADITDLRVEAWPRAQFLRIPSAKWTRSSTQSIGDSSLTTVAVTEDYNDEHPALDLWSIAAGVVTVNRAGRYRLTAGANWASNSTGLRLVTIDVGGADVAANRKGANGVSEATVSTVMNLAASTAVKVEVLQSSGGPLNVGGDPRTFLAIEALSID